MKTLAVWIATAALACATATDDFIARAAENHGESGAKAARFLVDHMPAADRAALTADFLTANLDLALKARESFPWAKSVPDKIFLNDVLPYAVFDETRDPWRADFLAKAAPLVAGAATASEAAQALNRGLFKLVQTHYDTARMRPNQSPAESIRQGKATCTGLSIILVDACRAVGIPARAVGTPLWSNCRGNHTWVEIWDGGWHFTGADESDPKGLDRGWFTGDAARADAANPLHAIYATSWKHDGPAFPMVWAPGSDSVGAVDVTARYAKSSTAPAPAEIGVRYFESGQRREIPGQLTDAAGKSISAFRTKAGTADLNDMSRLHAKAGRSYRLRFEIDGSSWQTAPFTAAAGPTTINVNRADLQPVKAALTRDQAAALIEKTFQEITAVQRETRAAELDGKSIAIAGKTLRWLEKTAGDAPPNGRSLWISMHGGGGAPAAVNDGQWRNQLALYQPAEGIYVAPRAPTDTWNLWHEAHIDPLFSRLIEDMIALRGVDPDKVYLMGYSAGGDGVWQLAPRMADRFAAAAMMAGHPNEASLAGLRNLPFAIFMGADDAAYDRNKIAAAKALELDALQKSDPAGYIHEAHIFPGLGHWMNRKDAIALPWMAKFSRNPWPRKIVWHQDDVTHERFYWLQLPPGTAQAGTDFTANVAGQKIDLTGDFPPGTRLLLHDALLDLDKPILVSRNGAPVSRHEVARSSEVIRQSLATRLDPKSTPTAVITLD